jgi:hypothetical protein
VINAYQTSGTSPGIQAARRPASMGTADLTNELLYDEAHVSPPGNPAVPSKQFSSSKRAVHSGRAQGEL